MLIKMSDRTTFNTTSDGFSFVTNERLSDAKRRFRRELKLANIETKTVDIDDGDEERFVTSSGSIRWESNDGFEGLVLTGSKIGERIFDGPFSGSGGSIETDDILKVVETTSRFLGAVAQTLKSVWGPEEQQKFESFLENSKVDSPIKVLVSLNELIGAVDVECQEEWRWKSQFFDLSQKVTDEEIESLRGDWTIRINVGRFIESVYQMNSKMVIKTLKNLFIGLIEDLEESQVQVE